MQQFKEGMAHATIAGPWLIPTVRESGMDVGIAPMPVIDETGTPISPYMGVQGIQVLKNAAEKKPEAVEEVLRVPRMMLVSSLQWQAGVHRQRSPVMNRKA